jgi:hypothetical protein
MSRSGILAAVCLAFAVAACGAAAPNQSSPAPLSAAAAAAPSTAQAPAASQSPSATPAPSISLTQDEIRLVAGKAYLAAVKPQKAGYAKLFKAYQKSTSLAAARKYCAGLAAIDRKVLLALKAIEYPTDTAADGKVHIRYVASQDANERICAKAKTWSEWSRFDKLATKANERAVEAANLVRLDLGLPPIGGG